jgi:hypothetical protein
MGWKLMVFQIWDEKLQEMFMGYWKTKKAALKFAADHQLTVASIAKEN